MTSHKLINYRLHLSFPPYNVYYFPAAGQYNGAPSDIVLFWTIYYSISSAILLLEMFPNQNKTKTYLAYMQMKVLTPVFAVLVTISLAMLHMTNADSFLSSAVQPREKQDAMKATITDGLRLANQSSQHWQEKQQHNQSNQQQHPLIANGLNSNSNNKFDNHSPSVISELPF
jgi:hypothetical protein